MRRFRFRPGARAVVAVVVAMGCACLAPGSAQAEGEEFFTYTGSEPLASLSPGTVLQTRTVPYHLAGMATPLQAVQILYRTTDARGEPAANVTSVLKVPSGPAKGVVSYQSAYDSLNPADSPSRAIAGDFDLFGMTPVGRNIAVGNVMSNAENAILPAVLALGYAVNIPDTEGQRADFAAGPEYGMTTLDSLRAIDAVSDTGVVPGARIGLVGYSGGAIGSNWAASLAPGYAPDIDRRIVGVAEGGVLVNPARNLQYVSGSLGWAGVVGMAVNGVARAYDIDFDQYTNDYGKQVLRQLSDASILNFWYPGLTWQKTVEPQYADPNAVPPFVEAVNKINLGAAPVPTAPMLIDQGTGGYLEGTAPGGPGIGDGDGVMIAGDVRALANRYCDAGVPVQYHEFGLLSHTMVPDIWGAESVLWLLDRFADKPVPNNCALIPPGNPDALTPQQPA